MVKMAVGRDREHGAFVETGNLLAKAYQARAGIDQQAAQPTAHEPDVAAVEGQDVRLLDMHDLVIHGPHLVPAIRRLYAHGSSLRLQQGSLPDGTVRAPIVQPGTAAPTAVSRGQVVDSCQFPCDSTGIGTLPLRFGDDPRK